MGAQPWEFSYVLESEMCVGSTAVNYCNKRLNFLPGVGRNERYKADFAVNEPSSG